MERPKDQIGIQRDLAKRLYPAILAVSILIAVGLPATYYFLASQALKQTATIYAQELSEELEDSILDAPNFLTSQPERYKENLRGLFSKEGLVFVQVLDEKGASLPQYGYTAAKGAGWWNLRPVVASAPLILSNQRIGTLHVGVSQGYILGMTVGTLLLSSAVAGGFFALAYIFPTKVVKGIEGQIQELVETVERSEQTQRLLKELSQDITSLEVDKLLTKIAQNVREFFRVDICDVRLIEPGGSRIVGASGIEVERLRVGTTGSGRGISGWIRKNRRPLVVTDITQDRTLPVGETTYRIGIRGYVAIPLFSRSGEVIGTLRVLTHQPREFTQGELDLLQQVGNGAAIAIENARLFEEVQKKSREIEEAYSAKTQFLNTMAHEIKTPLNVLVGIQQLFIEGLYGELNDSQRKGFAVIERNVRALLNLINELLELSRLEARQVSLHLEDISVMEIVDEIESSFIPLVREKGLDLKFQVDDEKLQLKSDKSKLKQVLQNLVGNAVKYTDRGEVTVEFHCAPDDSETQRGKGRLTVVVRDKGMGINEEDLQRIFEPFYMVEGLDRKKYPGSGLGLNIVKRLVELLHGEIQVKSELGKGSTFTVTLPIVHTSKDER